MCQRNLIWCAFVLVASSTEPPNSTRNDDGKLVLYANSTKDHNTSEVVKFHESTTENSYADADSLRYGFHARYMKNEEISQASYQIHSNFTDDDVNSNSMLNKLNNNFTESNSKKDSTSQDFHKYYTMDQNNTVLYEMCDDRICIQLCCPFGDRYVKRKCVTGRDDYILPDVYDYTTSSLQNDKRLDDPEIFQLIVRNPCETGYIIDTTDPRYEFMLLTNGSIYQPFYNEFTQPRSYCLAVVDEQKYDVLLCFSKIDKNDNKLMDYHFSLRIGLLVSLPFLLITFLVYTVLSELKNMHGYTLRGYVSSLFFGNMFLLAVQLPPQEIISNELCISLGFLAYFSYSASFFWLNVICFDIWWTFRGFRSLKGGDKQRERKKFIIYSIYAWGCASILTIVCIIMDFVPSVPKTFIRPEFGVLNCFFKENTAKALYFYGPMGATVLCNICMFVSTALKIMQHKKDTAHHLGGSESRRHDDNKQWFNLYLKLFIVMCISWSMDIISWLFREGPLYIWYIADLTNTLQGLTIFIIFVCKGKIKRMLLKRFGCRECGLFSRNSTNANHSSDSRTDTTTSGSYPLQDAISPNVQANNRANSLSNDTDCS